MIKVLPNVIRTKCLIAFRCCASVGMSSLTYVSGAARIIALDKCGCTATFEALVRWRVFSGESALIEFANKFLPGHIVELVGEV